MGELFVRKNGGITIPKYQTVEKTAKTSASASAQSAARVAKAASAALDSLNMLTERSSQSEVRTQESRQTLQRGEVALEEVQERLGRIAVLAEKAAKGGEAERAALQAELDQLKGEIDRMLTGATFGELSLFLDGDRGGVGVETFLYAVLSGALSGQESVRDLPAWLLGGLERGALSSGEMLATLGLDETASGAEIIAAVTERSLERDPTAGYLAAVYLGAVIAGGAEHPEPGRAVEGLSQLIESVLEGATLDEAIETLTDGAFTSLADFQEQFSAGTAPGMEQFLTELLLSGEADDGSGALLAMMTGTEELELELLMGLLDALGGAGGGLELLQPESGTEAAGTAPAGPFVEMGNVLVGGEDLSGVSLDGETGVLTVDGTADVLIQGTGRGEQAIVLAGSGTVTLRDAEISMLSIDTETAQVLSEGASTLAEVEMNENAELTLGGGGQLKIGTLYADETNTLRLTGGGVEIEEVRGADGETARLPVVLSGAASLTARSAMVTDLAGKPLEPFDLVLKTLVPGWSAVTAMELDGKQMRLALTGENADPLRLWLEKGYLAHGYTVHTLVIQGKDQFDRPRLYYAYLRWNQYRRAFEAVSMYPNPFTVTGGEEEKDWIYEEGTQTLRILTGEVSAISGGTGTDANEEPFSGRIVLEDEIGAVTLTLDGVECRVTDGGAFRLGRKNEVTLTLKNGTSNLFESGKGCAGIALGDGTSLCIDSAAPDSDEEPAGVLIASGGSGGAGIGRDRGDKGDRSSHIVINGGMITATGSGGGAGIGGALGASVGDICIRGGTVTAKASSYAAAIGAGVQGACGDILITGTASIRNTRGGSPGADIGAGLHGGCGRVLVSEGAKIGRSKLCTRVGIPLQMGEETGTLPQFPLSAGTLRLDELDVTTKECAQAARKIVEEDRRQVARIQTAYSILYNRFERGFGGFYSPRQAAIGWKRLVRDIDKAKSLLQDMRESILNQSNQAMYTHSRRSIDDVRNLLR